MASALARSSASRTRLQVGAHLGGVGRRVEDLALLAAGAADEHGADALGRVPGDGARTLRRLVVGVGVHRHEAQRVAGECRAEASPAKLVAAVAVPAQETGRYIATMSRRLTACFVALVCVVATCAAVAPARRGRGRGPVGQQRALGVAHVRQAAAVRDAHRPGRLHESRRRAGRPRGGAAAGDRPGAAPGVAGVQLRRSW